MRREPLRVLSALVLLAAASFAAAALLAPPSGADTPLPPPSVETIWSPNRSFCAVLDPRRQTTTVYRVEAGDRRTKAWAMVGWYRGAVLHDDGEHLVLCHPGLNLLPLETKEDDVLLWFVRRGELVATVAVGEVVPRAAWKRTASHWLWGGVRGLDAEGRYVVQTVTEQTVRFDVATGRRL